MRLVPFALALLLAACSAPQLPPADISATVQSQVRATVSSLAPTPTATSRFVAISEDGWVYATLIAGGPAQRVPVAGTATDFLAYRKSVDAKDDIGIRDLFLANRLVQIPVGTRVHVIDARQDVIDLAEVRFVDGDFATTTGWIDRSWVVPSLPNGYVRSPTPTLVP